MAERPTVAQAIDMPDPWQTARMRASAQFDADEQQIAEGVREAMTGYLAAVRHALLQDKPGPPPGQPATRNLVAAAEINVDLWPDDLTWSDLVTGRIIPKIAGVWGQAFYRLAKAALISAIPYREAFLQNVYSRLSASKWPKRVWDEVQHELGEALSMGESIDQMSERLGDLLGINALSRQLRDRAARLRGIRDNPDSTPAQKAESRRELREVYARLDDADLMWWPDVQRIARTEVIGATNGGTYAAAVVYAQESGETRYKMWLSARDERVRPQHGTMPGIGADGQVQELLTPFDVGGHPLLFPGDPNGPAHLVICCRCTLLIMDEEEAAQALDRYRQPAPDTTTEALIASGGNAMDDTTMGVKRGLPAYVKEVEKALREENGWDESRAIATAKNAVKRWCAGGGDVSAATRAKAC